MVVIVVVIMVMVMVVIVIVIVIVIPAPVLVVLQLRGQALARHRHPPGVERCRLSVSPVSVRQRRRRQGIRGFHCVEVDRSSAKRKDRSLRCRRAEEPGSCCEAQAADNRVATGDASRRQPTTPACSVWKMPDKAIGATQAVSRNRHEWRCEVRS